MSNKHSRQKQITGRDGYIVAQSLYEFVRVQQELDDAAREWSNMEDAKAILVMLFPWIARMFQEADERKGRSKVDLTLEKYADLTVVE